MDLSCIFISKFSHRSDLPFSTRQLYSWIKGYDTSRFVQYEGANRPTWGQLPHVYDREDSSMGTDIICPMYPTIKDMVEWADVIAPGIAESRPFIMCGAFLNVIIYHWVKRNNNFAMLICCVHSAQCIVAFIPNVQCNIILLTDAQSTHTPWVIHLGLYRIIGKLSNRGRTMGCKVGSSGTGAIRA